MTIGRNFINIVALVVYGDGVYPFRLICSQVFLSQEAVELAEVSVDLVSQLTAVEAFCLGAADFSQSIGVILQSQDIAGLQFLTAGQEGVEPALYGRIVLDLIFEALDVSGPAAANARL